MSPDPNAHMSWDAEIEASLLANKVKHVLIYRDPRDTIVSMMRWQTYNPNFVTSDAERQRQTELQLGFANDRDRIRHFILLMRWNDYSDYSPWLKSPACHAVRFEDIYREITSGEAEMPTVRRLYDYLEVTLQPEELRACLHNSVTSSGEKSKIGAWRQFFGAEELALLEYPQFKQSMSALGYRLHSPAITKTETYRNEEGALLLREYWDTSHPDCPKHMRDLNPRPTVYIRAEPVSEEQ